ncbi:solute carrier family 49 member A3 [Bombina bombina]|uniref:solute carrier family 49 member A3 n=1 Tax=Bombina bombina TaxID=8345 RepID=UPI00235A484F|nr:solute carrier family 49 member A3 [Bombina bombina]
MFEQNGDTAEAADGQVQDDDVSDPTARICEELLKLNQLRVYKWRWFVLGVVCLINCSNAMLWISFAPVADLTASFFSIPLDIVNLFSLVYLVISIPVGFGASWLLDTLGLKSSILLSSWLNMIGSVIRCLSIITFLNTGGVGAIYIFVGQCICAIAQPLILFVPAKLAAVWFPDHQRATANMIASMSNPLGILLANVLSPTVVKVAKDVPKIIGLYSLPAVLACTLATFGVCDKAPPSPPSASARKSTSEPFCSGVWQLLNNKAYCILMLCFGAGIGIFTAFSAFLEQILCFNGYSNFFSGLCGALFIFFGIIGALLCGLYVDKTKRFTEVVKICFSMASLASIAFAVVSNFRNQSGLLAIICSIFGFFGFSVYPIAMELAVECSYPIGEGTSTGLAFISGQFQGLVYMVIFQKISIPFAVSSLSSCGVNQIEIYNWSYSTLVLAGLCSFFSCIFVIFFHTDYKRLNAEMNPTPTEEETQQIGSEETQIPVM